MDTATETSAANRSPSPIPFERTKVIAAGTLLVIGFLMPILVIRSWDRGPSPLMSNIEYDLYFPGLRALSPQVDMPLLARCKEAFPGVAGLALLIMAAFAPSVVRGSAMIGLGIAGLVILPFVQYASSMEGSDVALGLLVCLPLVLGIVGILGGSAARSRCPRSRSAGAVGLTGSVITLVALVMPVLPRESGRLLLAVPFMPDNADTGVLMQLLPGVFLCLIAASVNCILSAVKRSDSASKRFAQWGWWLSCGAVAILFVCFIIDDCSSGVMMIRFVVSRMMTQSLAWFILMPLGLTILLVALSARASSARP